MASVLSAVAVVPSTPLLSEALAGAASAELADLRAAVRAAGDELRRASQTWIAVGSAAESSVVDASSVGTYVGFGVDVVVSLSPAQGEPDRSMELAALTVGLVRGRCAPDLSVPTYLVAVDADEEECARVAASVRAAIDETPGPVGLLVIADGSTMLTDKAPGAFDDRAEGLQRVIDDAVATADTAALRALDVELCRELGVAGRAALQVAAVVVGSTSATARTLYRDAPYGVGYHVAVWVP